MNYEISVSESGKYIIARIFTNMDFEIAGYLKADVDQLAEEKKIKRLFLDLRLSRNKEKPMSNLAYTYYEIPPPLKTPFEKTAFLVSPEDNSHDIIIVSGTNAGHNFRRFIDEQEAISWLTK